MQDLSIKSLSIIIPNYNGAQLLREYFPSVLAAAAKYSGKFEIIIVDDASTDDSRIVITEFTNRHSFIKGIFAKENGGFSKSCNLGMAATQMDICFFLNTDATLKEDCFEHFQEHFENDKVFAVTICGYKMGTSEQIDGIKLGKWRRGKLRATENLLDDDIARLKLSPPFHSLSVQGAYFFADANKLRELNGFDEIYSPFFLEETDLCYRALKRGWEIFYEPKCRGCHQVSTSIKSAASDFRIKKISARNNYYFVWTNIHDSSLFRSHLLFLVIRLLTLNIVEWAGLFKALSQIGIVRAKRRMEKEAAVKSDREILEFFKRIYEID